MDIPDIDLVIVYGVPSNILQLHQLYFVYNFEIVQCEVTNYFLQLFGRAGRGGSVARAHLFFNIRQKNIDPVVKAFCSGLHHYTGAPTVWGYVPMILQETFGHLDI